MSKARVKANHHSRPFIKNEKLTIFASHADGKITKFTATKESVTKEFIVVNHNITKAWQEMEQWLGNFLKEPTKQPKK